MQNRKTTALKSDRSWAESGWAPAPITLIITHARGSFPPHPLSPAPNAFQLFAARMKDLPLFLSLSLWEIIYSSCPSRFDDPTNQKEKRGRRWQKTIIPAPVCSDRIASWGFFFLVRARLLNRVAVGAARRQLVCCLAHSLSCWPLRDRFFSRLSDEVDACLPACYCWCIHVHAVRGTKVPKCDDNRSVLGFIGVDVLWSWSIFQNYPNKCSIFW